MRRGALVVSAAALALVAGGCSSDGPEEDVERYVGQANSIQEAAAPELARANSAFARFSSGELPVEGGPEELERAERSIRATRTELARLQPPAEARALHARLLRFFDLNADLAGETTALVRYLPAAQTALRALPAASRRLTRSLRDASGPAGQERALARYRRPVDQALRRLRRLDPPPVLAASHRSRVRQLRSIASLAGRLGRAIRERDSQAVARLLLRFRRRQEAGAGAPTADRRSLRAYERRYRAVGSQAAAIRREEARLREELG